MECQTNNVTANVQSDHLLYRYMLPVFFATDQLHHPPCMLCLNSAHVATRRCCSATRPYSELVLDTCEKKSYLKNKNVDVFWDTVYMYLNSFAATVSVYWLAVL